MGSDFLTNKQFQTALEENPELITWSSLREVILYRGKTGKLGFKVHTFKVLFCLLLILRTSQHLYSAKKVLHRWVFE